MAACWGAFSGLQGQSAGQQPLLLAASVARPEDRGVTAESCITSRKAGHGEQATRHAHSTTPGQPDTPGCFPKIQMCPHHGGEFDWGALKPRLHTLPRPHRSHGGCSLVSILFGASHLVSNHRPPLHSVLPVLRGLRHLGATEALQVQCPCFSQDCPLRPPPQGGPGNGRVKSGTTALHMQGPPAAAPCPSRGVATARDQLQGLCPSTASFSLAHTLELNFFFFFFF